MSTKLAKGIDDETLLRRLFTNNIQRDAESRDHELDPEDLSDAVEWLMGYFGPGLLSTVEGASELAVTTNMAEHGLINEDGERLDEEGNVITDEGDPVSDSGEAD